MTTRERKAFVLSTNSDLRSEGRRDPVETARKKLQRLTKAGKVCLAPSDAYDIPCGCCQRTAEVIQEFLALGGADGAARPQEKSMPDQHQEDAQDRVSRIRTNLPIVKALLKVGGEEAVADHIGRLRQDRDTLNGLLEVLRATPADGPARVRPEK